MSNSSPKLAFFFLSLAATLSAQNPQIDRVLHQLEEVHTFSDVTISPDGKWIAWIQPAAHLSEKHELYLLDWKNSSAHPQRITPANDAAHPSGVTWSPDSTQLAFFAAQSSQDQIFVFPVSSASNPGATARRLTSLNGYATDIRWSSDGKRIAFLYAENGGGGGPLQAVPAQTGPIGSDLHNQRLTVLNADGSALQQLTPADLNIYEYDWSPDGKRFAALAAPGPADNNWWIAQLYVLDIRSGEMKVLYHPPVDRQ